MCQCLLAARCVSGPRSHAPAPPFPENETNSVAPLCLQPNRELSRLFRLLRKEGFQERFRAQHYHVSPSEERVVAQKATAQRLAKQKFKQMMSYIMKRRERCAPHWFIWICACGLRYPSC